MNLTRTAATAALALGTSLGLAACGEGSSGYSEDVASDLQGPVQQWYEGTRDEPALQWYSLHDPLRTEETIAAFEEEYPGVEVEPLRLTSAELAVRYTQERESDARTADLVTVTDPKFIADAVAKGWFEPFTKADYPSMAALDDKWLVEGGAAGAILPLGIGYNTDLVSDPPTDWEDVLDPKYRGKIIYPDFRPSPSGAFMGQLWMDLYGEDFLERFDAQDLTVVDSMVPGSQQLGAGQGDLMVPAVPSNLEALKEQGAPVDIVFPENIVGAEIYTSVSTDTPASNTAKLLLDFIFSEEGQEDFVGTTSASPLGSEGSIPLPAGYVQGDYDQVESIRDTMQSVFQLP